VHFTRREIQNWFEDDPRRLSAGTQRLVVAALVAANLLGLILILAAM
jgi:hypothetical protein